MHFDMESARFCAWFLVPNISNSVKLNRKFLLCGDFQEIDQSVRHLGSYKSGGNIFMHLFEVI